MATVRAWISCCRNTEAISAAISGGLSAENRESSVLVKDSAHNCVTREGRTLSCELASGSLSQQTFHDNVRGLARWQRVLTLSGERTRSWRQLADTRDRSACDKQRPDSGTTGNGAASEYFKESFGRTISNVYFNYGYSHQAVAGYCQ
jgi:hypothetical protein